jgi:hypothetical protein
MTRAARLYRSPLLRPPASLPTRRTTRSARSLSSNEQLRDRLIRLRGHGRLTATTKAVDDAMHRISRFLVMQLIVNGTYGLALAIGLLVLDVKYALLWGLLAAVLRYIPYLGASIAAAPPILLSFVMSAGWTQPLLVVGWIVLVELVSNNVVEPLLYGHSIGVSVVALLVAAAFWTVLWGPIGLVLSSPLTVCLVVLGKYSAKLQFIDILLGDGPALQPYQTLYQRLLARDTDEARAITQGQLSVIRADEVYDALLVPALAYFKGDLEQHQLTERDERFLLSTMRELVGEVGQHCDAPPNEGGTDPDGDLRQPARRARLLLLPADGEADELAVEMLRDMLSPARWDVCVLGDEVLAAELIDTVQRENFSVVCIGSVSPGGLGHIRYFCKRLRASRSDLRIVVGRWGSERRADFALEQFRAAGADEVHWTLLETSRRLDSWWSVIAERTPQSA